METMINIKKIIKIIATTEKNIKSGKNMVIIRNIRTIIQIIIVVNMEVIQMIILTINFMQTTISIQNVESKLKKM